MAFFFSWGLAGAVAVVLDVGQGGGPGLRCVLLSLLIMMKFKILNSVKTKSTLSFGRKSL